jgi:hypothetical protein
VQRGRTCSGGARAAGAHVQRGRTCSGGARAADANVQRGRTCSGGARAAGAHRHDDEEPPEHSEQRPVHPAQHPLPHAPPRLTRGRAAPGPSPPPPPHGRRPPGSACVRQRYSVRRDSVRRDSVRRYWVLLQGRYQVLLQSAGGSACVRMRWQPSRSGWRPGDSGGGPGGAGRMERA